MVITAQRGVYKVDLGSAHTLGIRHNCDLVGSTGLAGPFGDCMATNPCAGTNGRRLGAPPASRMAQPQGETQKSHPWPACVARRASLLSSLSVVVTSSLALVVVVVVVVVFALDLHLDVEPRSDMHSPTLSPPLTCLPLVGLPFGTPWM